MNPINRLRNWWGKSLRRKALASTLTGTVFFLLLLGTLSFYVGQSSLCCEVNLRNSQLATLVAREIETYFGNAQDQVRLLAYQLEAADELPSRQARLMLELRRLFPLTYRALYLLDGEGQLLIHLADPLEDLLTLEDEDVTQITDRPPIPLPDQVSTAYQAARDGAPFLSPPHVTADDRVPIVYVAIPTPIEPGQPERIVVAEIDVRNVWQQIEEVRVGKTGRAFVASSEGVIVAHPDRAYVGRPLAPELGRVLAGQEGQAEYTDPWSGHSMLAAYSPVSEPPGWGVVVEQERGEALAPVNRIAAVTLGVLPLASALTAVTVVLSSRGTVRSLRRLEETTRAIAQTVDLDRQVPVERGDEIGQLAVTFNHMVTSLRETERALRESEERYRSLFEDVPVGLYRTTPEGQILDVNPALVTMLGYPDRRSLLEDGVVSGYQHHEERRLWQSLVERKGQVQGYETKWRRYDGTEIWVRESTYVVRDDGGRVLYYEGAVEDITEHRRIEDALRESEQRFRSLYLAMNEGLAQHVVLYDEAGQAVDYRVTDVNPAYESITGIAREDAVSQVASELYGTGQAPYLEIYADVAETGEPASFETYFPPMKKHLKVSAFSPGQGRFATVFTDITERKKTEQALRESEQALQRYIERLRTLHAIDGAILAARSADEIAQAALRHIHHLVPCRRASVATFDQEQGEATLLAVQTDRPTRQDVGTRCTMNTSTIESLRQGNVHVVKDVEDVLDCSPDLALTLREEGIRSCVTVPLIARGELIGVFNLGGGRPNAFTPEHVDIAREVADPLAVALYQARLREQIEQQVEKLEQRVTERTAELSVANVELARAVRLKDEFLASMSHELRTPLNAILGMSEVLRRGIYGSLDERQLKAVHIIEESGRHLLSLINDVLDIAKIEAGKVELQIVPLSVETVCRDSLQLVKQQAQAKEIEVVYSPDDEVTLVQADERRLKQILANLLSNAVKFTPQGGKISLEVAGDAAGQVVHFTVWDTGIGIPQEDMKRLFKPFVQLDSSLSREYTGTGLGLALVYRLTEMHGGSVAVESEEGKGSRFTVSLPWAASQEPGEPQVRETREQEGEDEETTGRRRDKKRRRATVLLAEDNQPNIDAVSDCLTAEGYRVVAARNGTEAIERAQEERPDVILMDIQMPGMDGLEAIRRIRANADLEAIPIVALTALAMPGDRERCLKAGANAYLSKPISLDDLLLTVEKQLNQPTPENQPQDGD